MINRLADIPSGQLHYTRLLACVTWFMTFNPEQMHDTTQKVPSQGLWGHKNIHICKSCCMAPHYFQNTSAATTKANNQCGEWFSLGVCAAGFWVILYYTAGDLI